MQQSYSFITEAGSKVMPVTLLLTRRLSMLSSAEVCPPAATHQNAAVALLQQVLITQSAGRHTSASLLKII
ncbi:MAG: hypothetical protein ABW138_10825, partial [Candidatus Thiodiazotropha sp. 4PDIVS1]